MTVAYGSKVNNNRRPNAALWYCLCSVALWLGIPMPFGVCQQAAFDHQHLWNEYQEIKISPERSEQLKHEQLLLALRQLAEKWPSCFYIEIAGRSVQGREIYLVKLGRGAQRILLWSQMHGDEPTATNALLDIFNFLLVNRQAQFAGDILEGATILVLPMLNPDGAECHERRNAQDIDVNRDARDLQTPEGRILKQVRDRFEPQFGFNLHDQSSRRTVGRTNKLAAVALMAPPFDWENNDNEVRIRAKKVASVILQSLAPFAYGHVSKYDADYMPRAFGDSMQSWGTSTVLFETGGWYEDDPELMVKLNFVGILSALHAIATGSYESANPALYDALPQNDKSLFDLLIIDAEMFDGENPFTYKVDVGINFSPKRETNGFTVGRIADLGDLDGFAGKDTIIARGKLLLPGFIGLMPSDSGKGQDKAMQSSQICQGYTTLVCPCPLNGVDSLVALLDSSEQKAENLNMGFIIDCAPQSSSDLDGRFEGLGKFLAKGGLGLLISPETDKDKFSDLQHFASLFGAVVVKHGRTIDSIPGRTLSWEKLRTLTSEAAQKYAIPDRGVIRINKVADLVLFAPGPSGVSSENVTLGEVSEILLGGHTAYRSGEITSEGLGRILTRCRTPGVSRREY